MTKQSATDTFEAQKEKLQEIIDKLADQFDLSEEDLATAKEWGIALLVTGVSAYLVFRLLRRVFGSSEEEVVLEEEPDSDEERDDQFAAIASMLKGQVALFLTSIARREIMRFLRKNNLVDDDE